MRALLQIVFLSRHLPILSPKNVFNLSFKLVLDFRHDFDEYVLYTNIYIYVCLCVCVWRCVAITDAVVRTTQPCLLIPSSLQVAKKLSFNNNKKMPSVVKSNILTLLRFSRTFHNFYSFIHKFGIPTNYTKVRCNLVTMAVANNTKNKMHETRCAKIKFICVLRCEFQWDFTLFISVTPFFLILMPFLPVSLCR